jgi:acyl-coenzyme A synthetase/AMP-(fatty) acid ligase
MSVSDNLRSFLGYKQGDVVVSDLPNIAENLILQIACSRIGVTYATVKDVNGLDALRGTTDGRVRGAITCNKESFLASAALQHAAIVASDDDQAGSLHELFAPANGGLSFPDNNTVGGNWGFFNSTKALSAEEVVQLGTAAGEYLNISEADRVCVSITLCHAFGIASACAGTFLNGGAVVLPAVGGIRGCGVASQRADATLETLVSQRCTLLFADTHTLKALPEPTVDMDLSALRGGVVKVGSGSDFMEEEVQYAGVSMHTMSKRK